MSQKPVDLERAIEALREDVPPAGGQERAYRRIVSRKRRRSWTPVVATGLAVALIAWAAFPRKDQGSAWAQVAGKAKGTLTYHNIMFDAKGRKVREGWQTPDKKAWVMWKPDGSVRFEMRNDGHRTFFYNPIPAGEPNGIDAASVRTNWHEERQWIDPAEPIDALLKLPAARLLSQEKYGNLDRYQIEMYGNRVTVDVDPETGLPGKMTFLKGGHEDLDYPTSIDPSIFAPRPGPGEKMVTLDADKEYAEQALGIQHGIAKKDGITLRSVSLDRGGNLWVLWTGYVPDGRLSRTFTVPGVPVGPAYEPGPFTTSWNKHFVNHRYMVDGLQLAGMYRELMKKIGSTITVKVPAARGFVTFKDVPVHRILEWTEIMPRK